MIKAYVMAHRDAPNRYLAMWLHAMRVDWRLGSPEFGIDVSRNQAVNRFLREDVPLGFTHLLMIDKDMVPFINTNEMLTAKGDLLWCPYVGRNGIGGHVDNFGAGFCRLSASMLEQLEKPYFRFTHNETHDRLLDCECNWFCRRAMEKGFTPQAIGWVGHQVGDNTGPTLIPNKENKTGYSLAWTTDLPYDTKSSLVRASLINDSISV